ncbi:MAG: phosphoribosylglycinamide formyltransferase [Defluviitaleaceae bacterium]|nr:phosphoribosylglycinamide formyltransferase [Defluviitaleaceae bacterium]
MNDAKEFARATPKNIAVFASHGGTNLQAIIDGCAAKKINARVCVVISNNRDAFALQRARDAKIAAVHVAAVPRLVSNDCHENSNRHHENSRRANEENFSVSQHAHEKNFLFTNEKKSSVAHEKNFSLAQRTLEILRAHNAEIIFLAGYLKKIPDEVLAAFDGKIFNIHPSLLPKFGGKGMFGINVHAAVLAARETETGITIHRVTAEYDAGDILAQKKVAVHADDTPEILAARVLAQEHIFLVEFLARLCE